MNGKYAFNQLENGLEQFPFSPWSNNIADFLRYCFNGTDYVISST